MASHTQHLPIGEHGLFAHIEPVRVPLWWSRVRTAIARTGCALRGHDLLLHADHGRRLCLRCVSCGYESPGWILK